MGILTDTGRRAGCFIASEAEFWRSRDHVLIASGILEAGTVLGQASAPVPTGLLVVSPKQGGNVGNGVVTPDATAPVGVSARPGPYMATLTTVAANGGTFTVTDPLGETLGTVAVGATFSNGIKFVIADGSTDFALGDQFILAVSREEGLWASFAPGGSGGVETAAGVLFDRVDATFGPVRAVALTRQFEADDKMLVWPAGMTASQKVAALNSLAARGVVVRTR
jgi:hypothetical protein